MKLLLLCGFQEARSYVMSVLKGAERFYSKSQKALKKKQYASTNHKLKLHAPRQRYVQPLTETEIL